MNYLMRACGVIFAVCGGSLLSMLIADPEATSTQPTMLGVALLAPAMGLWKFATGKW